MPRASGSAARTAAAAKNVSSNAGHSEPSCSTPPYQKVFRPVTRSMSRMPPAIAATPDLKERVDSTSSRRSIPDASFSTQLAASRPTGHSEPSCSTPPYQKVFRPVTRSMSRMPPAIAATPDLKERVDSTSSRRSIPDASFSTQLAASRPTVTRARTPHEVTRSAWKPLTQPAVLSEELKRASTPATNPTTKRSRVTSSQAAKDSASKANRNVRSGKNNRNEECDSQRDQLDRVVIPSPPKKLQSGKSSSDVVSKRNPAIRRQGAKLAAPLLTGESETEIGKYSASVIPLPAHQLQSETAKTSGTSQVNQSVAPAITEATSGGTSQVRQSVALATKDAIVRGKRPVNQSVPPFSTEAIGNRTWQINQSGPPVFTEAIGNRTRQINQLVAPVSTETIGNRTRQITQLVAPVSTEAIGNRTRQVNQLVAPVSTEAIDNRTRQANQFVAPVVTLPRQHSQTSNQQRFIKLPLPTSHASVPAGATGPMVVPKVEIGNVNDSSNALSDPAYRRALLIKQQEQLLKQFSLANSQSELHIKGPALFEDDDVPEPEPLGTRCSLCKLDLAFQPQGGMAHDPSAPPVVAVLACHHTFHSRCIEDVYGLAEPSQCLACLDSGTA